MKPTVRIAVPLIVLLMAVGMSYAQSPTPAPAPPVQACRAGCKPTDLVLPTTITNCSLTTCSTVPFSPQPYKPLPIWTSANKTLTGTLTAAPACIKQLPDFLGPQNVYNGSITPPVWYLSPGDAIDLTVVNKMNMLAAGYRVNQSTNVHYHGFNVPPNNFAGQIPGDSVFVAIPPKGGKYRYRIPIPASHPVGAFWYHPHPHEVSEPQLLGGMSGVVIVRGLIKTYYPSLLPVLGAGIPDNGGTAWGREQVFLLKDYVPCGKKYGGCAQKYVNGLTQGSLNVQPGVQFWRFANAGADQFYNLQVLDGQGQPLDLFVIGVDGNPATTAQCPAQNGVPVACPRVVQNLQIPPGGRMDVLVQLPAGTYALSDAGTHTGPAGDVNCPVQLAQVNVSGTPGPPFSLSKLSGTVAISGRLSQQALAAKAIQNPCNDTPATIAFTETAATTAQPGTFSIDNKAYNPGRLDKTITNAPCVAEWTITNKNPRAQELHVFHIHQTDFIVTAVTTAEGQQAPFVAAPGYQDTVTVPFGGSVTVLIPFEPDIAGYFVYHCHILNHEDQGMMANICVQGAGPGQQCVSPPHAPAHSHR